MALLDDGGSSSSGAAEGVDEDGRPETPAVQASEKKKLRNRQYAALAIGAVGIVVAIVLAKRNAAANSSSSYPTGLGTSGTVASGPTDTTGGDPTAAFGSLLSQLQAGQAANTAALQGLTTNLGQVQQELHAQHGNPPNPPKPSPAPKPALPQLVSSVFAKFLPGAGPNVANVEQTGTIQNGRYTGKQVSGGAPVYALVNTGFGPIWEQNANFSQLPSGTKVGTPASLHNYVQQ